MPDLIFYPYQLENGSYIDKASGKSLKTSGIIYKYPINTTPYKTSKNYVGGCGFYKNSSNRGTIIYIDGYNMLNSVKDFTIYFWEYQVPEGCILTFDDTGGDSGFCITVGGCFYTGSAYFLGSFSPATSKWTFHEYTFKQSGNNYTITAFYNGVKKFSGTISSYYIKKSCTILGSWSYAPLYAGNGFYGYIYDFSIYNGILHTANYDRFPRREMNPNTNIEYISALNEDNLYGMI